jgi:hypothetical protein
MNVNRLSEATSLNAIGRVHLEQGQDAAAEEAFSRSLTLFQALGVKEEQAYVMYNRGLLHLAQDPSNSSEPWKWFSQSLALAEQLSCANW